MPEPEWYWLVEDAREDDPEDGGTPPPGGNPYVVALQGPGFMLRLEGMWHATEKEAEDFIRSFEGAKLRTEQDFIAALRLNRERVHEVAQSYCLDPRCRETGPTHLHAPDSAPRGLY